MAKRNENGETAVDLCRKCWQAYEWACDDVKKIVREMAARGHINDADPHPNAWRVVELWQAGWASPKDGIVPELEKLLRYINAAVLGARSAAAGYRWVVLAEGGVPGEGVAVSVSSAAPSHGMPIGYRVYKVKSSNRDGAVAIAKLRFVHNIPSDPYDA
jgi:hypothetical protein